VKINSVWAIVPAAGIGSRMLADRPKQYLNLDGKTVLEQTLLRLASHPQIEGIVIAVAQDDPWWHDITLNVDCQIHTVEGGDTRADSVFNALIGLADITENDPWVLVHDAARPCLRLEDIDQMLAKLKDHPVGGILGIPVNDTVKRVNNDLEIEETVCRQGLWRAATPQMFRLAMLTHALASSIPQSLSITDDASAIELAGFKPLMIGGHPDNIKITVPQDLALASLYLQQQREEV
jgi:2-C-methyl-D-erythritol 4-phosphate cytidylyltransferase